MLGLAQQAINEVRGDRLVERAAANAGLSVPLDVVAVGKAASEMMAGAHAALGAHINRSLLITKTGHVSAEVAGRSDIEILESGHPVPTTESLVAGQRLLEWITAADQNTHLLFLISGGTSSLVEAPVPGIGLPELQAINRWLLASGLDIAQMNSIRRRVSRIKGGGLLRHAGNRRISVWLLSDVPGDHPALIGSGPLYPSATVEQSGIQYPPGLKDVMAGIPARQQGDIDNTGLPAPEHRILGNLRMACEAARNASVAAGFHTRFFEQELDGDAEATGRQLARQLEELPGGVYIWGGETTVCLPEKPGRGGRNQHLALAAAIELAGHEDICLLALGSDGSDGPGEDAGALVDGGTIGRGELGGLDAAEALRRADSGSFLEASGDLVSTGATGTNVRDLVIAIKI